MTDEKYKPRGSHDYLGSGDQENIDRGAFSRRAFWGAIRALVPASLKSSQEQFDEKWNYLYRAGEDGSRPSSLEVSSRIGERNRERMLAGIQRLTTGLVGAGPNAAGIVPNVRAAVELDDSIKLLSDDQQSHVRTTAAGSRQSIPPRTGLRGLGSRVRDLVR